MSYDNRAVDARRGKEGLLLVVAASVAGGDGTLLDHSEFVLVHVRIDNSLNTIDTKGDGEGQAGVKLFAVGREGDDGEFVEGDAESDLGNYSCDTKSGGTLEVDDRVGLVGNLGSLGGAVHLLDLLKSEHGLASDAGRRPDSDLLVTVLTNDVSVDSGSGDLQNVLPGDAEADRVEVGAGSYDLVRGEAGELLGHAGEDVDGVGDEHEDSGLLDGLKTVQDRPENIFVTGNELVTALARLLAGTGCDDDNIGLTAFLGGANADFG